MNLLTRFLGDQRIDDWRSEYTLIAARTLNQVAADLIVQADKAIAEASWKDGLVSPAGFVNHRILPLLREVAEPVATSILEEANLALSEIIEVQAVWLRGPEHVDAPVSAFEGAGDVATAAVPLAVGVATAASLPFAAVSTTTGLFGLVSTTVVSWPVVVGGTAVVGLGLATGLLNSARLWEKTEGRLRDRVRRFLVTSLINGTDKTPSILQQLVMEFDRAAEKAKST